MALYRVMCVSIEDGSEWCEGNDLAFDSAVALANQVSLEHDGLVITTVEEQIDYYAEYQSRWYDDEVDLY